MPAPSFPRVVRPARVAYFSAFLAMAVVMGSLAHVPAVQAAAKKTDQREIAARRAFAAGHYQEALEIFAGLYADKLHPTYLRNIGRCYQNLEQPDKAIKAFRDYLRQAKDLSASENREVEAYIAEMEALKKKQEIASAPVAIPPANPLPQVAQPVVTTPISNVEPAPVHPNLLQVSTGAPEPAPAPAPFYKRGWFWGTVGGVVVLGVVGGLLAGGAFSKSSNHCPVGATCPP